MVDMRVERADEVMPTWLNDPGLIQGGNHMRAHASVLTVILASAGCASQQDLWRAQENIVANDNRIAESLGSQHAQILAGSDAGLSRELADLRQENEEILRRARQIADEATSARTIAADAIAGLERSVGAIGGPLGGVIGASIASVAEGVRHQDTRLIALESETRASAQRVDSIESSLDGRIRSELLSIGLTPEQAGSLQQSLSADELVALLAILGLSTGTGAFASKLGKSRSATQVAELQRRVETIEHKA